MDPDTKQVGGNHYQSNYQHWDFVRMALKGRYLEGCATKYLYRWRKKGGIEDLEKAIHYLRKMMSEHLFFHNPQPLGRNAERRCEAERFLFTNDVPSEESSIIHLIVEWETLVDLHLAESIIVDILAEEKLKFLPEQPIE